MQEMQETQVLSLGWKSPGRGGNGNPQRKLLVYSQWQSDTAERLSMRAHNIKGQTTP